MRIIGGELRGRTISAPKGLTSRPTTDRTREALFNTLTHRHGGIDQETRVIDAFAGSGALGLEALSHGAQFCLFIDTDPQARATIRENIEAFGLFGHSRIHRRSATQLGKIPASAGGPFTLAFLDPPYGKNYVMPCLQELHTGQWLRPDAIIVIEQSKNDPVPEHTHYAIDDHRHYGDTDILIACYNQAD